MKDESRGPRVVQEVEFEKRSVGWAVYAGWKYQENRVCRYNRWLCIGSLW